MALYMTQFSYTQQAWTALVKKPEDRSTVFNALMQKLGGRLLNLYYCFGEYDGVVIFEAPDAITCMGAILAAIAPGHLSSTKTTVLFTMDEAMEAMGKAGDMVYAGPKG